MGHPDEDKTCILACIQKTERMKITLLAIGRTEEEYLRSGMAIYMDRLKRYISFSTWELPALKHRNKINEAEQMKREGVMILNGLGKADKLFLLDERGMEYDSVMFAKFLQGKMNESLKSIVFAVGGPYGFSEDVRERANGMISLSKMTFSHQMVRLFFVEQLYRAMTILKGEPYHHE